MINIVHHSFIHNKVDACIVPVMEDFVFEKFYTRTIKNYLAEVLDINRVEKMFISQELKIGEFLYIELPKNNKVPFKAVYFLMTNMFVFQPSFFSLSNGLYNLLIHASNQNFSNLTISSTLPDSLSIKVQYAIIINAYYKACSYQNHIQDIKFNIIGSKKVENLDIIYDVLEFYSQKTYFSFQ